MARPSQTRKILNTVGAELQQELKSPGLSTERKKSVLRQLGQVGIALARLDHQEFKRREARAEKEPAQTNLPGNKPEGTCAANSPASPAKKDLLGMYASRPKEQPESEGPHDLLGVNGPRPPDGKPKNPVPAPAPQAAPEVKTEKQDSGKLKDPPTGKKFEERIGSCWGAPAQPDIRKTDKERDALAASLEPFANLAPVQIRPPAREPRTSHFMSMEALYGEQAESQPAKPVYDPFRESINSLSESGQPRPVESFGNEPTNELRQFTRIRSNE